MAKSLMKGFTVLCGMACAAGGGSAMAQSSGAQALLDNSWVVNLGAFVLSSDLKANLNGQSGANPEVDFDKTFGRDSDATRLRGDVLWRITPAHHLRFMYFNNTTKRSRVLDEDVHWGDYTFNAGSRTEFKHKYQVNELAYEYAFMRQPSYELSASIGVHYSKTNIQLSGDATITDGDGNVTNVSGATKANSLPAPLPVVGLRGGWVMAPQWYLDAQVQFFKVNIDGYDGRWTDLRVGATWMFSQHFGLGLGYNRFSTNVDVDRDSFTGGMKTSYSGLQAYLTGTF
jgi:hypothetical protein